MHYFIDRGPLSPSHPTFRGRSEEIEFLIQYCKYEVRGYPIIYGGRQTGKTSLLLRLNTLSFPSTNICRIDFQSFPGANTSQCFSFMASKILKAVSGISEINRIEEPPEFLDFLCDVIKNSGSRLVIVIEELGSLPNKTREDLANTIRSAFSNRHTSPYHDLSKVIFILSGSIELFELAVTEVSPLHNICEPLYLPDLPKEDAIELIKDGLSNLAVDPQKAQIFGNLIYKFVDGHPYLTQRIGSYLERIVRKGVIPELSEVNEIVKNIQLNDPLLLHIIKTIKERKLQRNCSELLSSNIRFSRLDDEMSQLELIGIAKNQNGLWIIRNSLFEQVLCKHFITGISHQGSTL